MNSSKTLFESDDEEFSKRSPVLDGSGDPVTPMTLQKRQESMQQKLKARTAAANIRKYVPEQLAFWSDDRRALANELARSALFQCRDNRKPRQYFDNVNLFMLGEGSMTYKGEELRTQEEDIFITFAHKARDLPSGKMVVKITSSEICKINDWRQDQRYYDAIFSSIQRMKSGVITVFSKRLAIAIKCQRAIDAGATEHELTRLHDELASFEELRSVHAEAGDRSLQNENGEIAGMMLNLIGGEPVFTGAKSIKNGIPQGNLEWEITLDKNMVSLFAKPFLTIVDFNARKKLNATGKRLQAYFLSHKEPYPVLLRSLEKMLGLQFNDIGALKFYIRKELEELKHCEIIQDYQFEKSAKGDDWKVTVTRIKPKTTQND